MKLTVNDAIRICQWGLAIAVLLLGVYMSWGGKTKWIIIGNAVHALPLVSLLLPWQTLRAVMLWFGVFLVMQNGYSLLTYKTELYKTLPKNMHDEFIVSGDILRSIKGHQTVTTDAYGFRVTKDIDYSDETPYRIFAIGASTTEQILLDDHKTWTHLLQERLGGNTEIINTGLSGLRAEHHLATFEAILPLNPDMAVFLIGVNDWNRHIREQFGSRHYQVNRFRHSLTVQAIRDGIKKLRHSAKKTAKELSGETGIRQEKGNFYKDKREALTRRTTMHSWQPQEIDRRYGRTLAQIADRCTAAQIKCVFLTQPHGYAADISDEYKASFWMTPFNEDFTLDLPSLIHVAALYNNALTDFACANGLYVFDLAAVIPAGFESFYDDVHFNEPGAQAVAAALAPQIKTIMQAPAPRQAESGAC